MLFTFGLVVFLDLETTEIITEEDHIIEYLGAISLFIASGFCLAIFIKVWNMDEFTLLRKLSYLGLALLFFFGGGEEVSWGQRIFNIETPESIANLNYQDELTIHNLQWFEDLGISVSDMFNLFWLAFTFLIPLSAAFIPRLRDFYEKFMPIVPWVFGLVFLTNWFLAKLAGMWFRSGADVSFVVHHVVETKESNYLFFLAVVAFYLWYTLRTTTQKKDDIANA